jgi:hypothetical protein
MNTVEALKAQLKAAREMDRMHGEALKMNERFRKDRAKAETAARIAAGKQQRAADRAAKKAANQAVEDRQFEIRNAIKNLGFDVKEVKVAVKALEKEAEQA